MPLARGQRLGPYEVLGPIGAGGMGEVFRARDGKLSREVALKVLPDHLSDDPKALARFESEAKAVAALSHPHILSIHDFGRIGGVSFAVMELLEGETLRGHLQRGALPLRKALELASQVSDALAAAHEKGIVHRDVKPENVFVTKEGRAKLLDFGLARRDGAMRGEADTRSPTVAEGTAPGTVLGTVAYMSPEQAQGLPADHRSDQFSLGVVLYEALTGKRAFVAPTAAETLTAILRSEPEPVERHAPATPAPVRWILDRLLAKDPAERYDSTRDLARELETCRLHLAEGPRDLTAAASVDRRRWRPRTLAAALVLALVLAFGAVLGAVLARTVFLRPPAPSARFEVRLPPGTFLERTRKAVALSPDGTALVYSAFSWKTPYEQANPPQLFVRRLDGLESKPIPGTEGGFHPVFSPDGRQIAFTVSASTASDETFLLRRVPAAGGEGQTICECNATFGKVWLPDGTIVFAGMNGPLMRVVGTGGTPEPVTRLDSAAGEVSHRLPHLLPDGKTIVYTALRWLWAGMTWKSARIYSWRLGSEKRRLLVEGGSDGRWVPPGFLLFAREGRLLALRLGADGRPASGSPVPVLGGVSHAIYGSSGYGESGLASLDVVGERLLAWVPGSVVPESRRIPVWVDRFGRESPLGVPKGPFLGGGRVSPDGGRVLLSYWYAGRQLELFDLARGTIRRVTFGANPKWATWGPGHDRVTFDSDHEGPVRLYSRSVDAPPEEIDTLWKNDSPTWFCPGDWSNDGRVLPLVTRAGENYDIRVYEPGQSPRPIATTRFAETHPDVSPDGRWLAYDSDEPGREEVFVRSLAGDGPPRQVSAGGGRSPRWSPDGEAILYWTGETAMGPGATTGPGIKVLTRVRVERRGETLSFGRPEPILESTYRDGVPCHGWDIAPDGRLLVARTDEADRRAYLDATLADRIVVDQGGIARLLADARLVP